ncbi:apolipoprotein B-100-like [Micropterus salmoides]|uniref:apolipoprotein B-100-like n=1 Tax=Micropterus salmoides TaxID=27706 RepID=UPI0018ECE69F|nr:apolipoprotein B-100-like [Micropterus salmoides]
MGGTKLCLLLLLGTYTLAQQDVGGVEEQSPVCHLAKRFKNFRRFVYNYEAETFNGVNGATDNKSGPKVSCKVEVDVPQTCSFILRTTECSLSEISGVDGEGNPEYQPAAGAHAFNAAMAKNPLKITVEGQTDVKLYPEDDEPVNILNIKRGIVSALIVPVMEEEMNKKMSTVHGVCSTDFIVNARQDIATDVTISRDLSKCDWFFARRQDTSPLALISGMNYPLSKMISSTQTCNYKFDNQKKHMTSGTCTEKHIFLPLSHQNEYGISAIVKQTVTLTETAKINDRIFDRNEDNLRYLSLDVADDKYPVQTKDAAIATMQQLKTLTQRNHGEERASLFRQLVSELRGLKVEVLGSATTDMMDMSSALTWQALAQCGTPECTSAMLKLLRTSDDAALEVDAVVYALGLLPNPSRLMVKDILAMAQHKQSKPIMYALSNAVRKLHEAEGVTPEITAVSEFMASLLGADCSGEKDLTFLTLRVVGNMGNAVEAADPAVKTILLKCMRQPATTLSVQLAAIQAFRRMSVTDEVRANLQRVCQYPKGAVQKRLAAYLILMRNPQDSDIEIVKKLLNQEQNVQVKAFVTSHIYNIISSTDSETQKLGKKIMDALQDTDVATHSDYTTQSRNYKLGVAYESMLAGIQGNIVFDPSSQLPREVLLETTLKAFGYNMDIWEVGMDGRGFEPTLDALFGKNGFFPDTVSKALYWAEDKMPPKIKEVLEKWVAPMKSEGQKVPENLVREIVRNFNKLVKDLQSQESPEAMAYLRIMGAELGYIKGNELKNIAENAKMFSEVIMNMIPLSAMAKLISRTDNEIFAHYIFMDNKFIMPTASGLPLTFAMSGTFTPGAKGGLRITPNMKELLFMPSVGVEFVTQMGVHVPEFVVSTVEMHTNMYHESALNAKITMEENEIKLSIPAPQGTTKLFSVSNKVLIVGAGQAAMIPHTEEEASCKPLFSGVKYCTKTLYANTGDKTAVPYFPLNGETKFAVDIQPSKEVSEYTATITYKLLSEGNDGYQKVDSLKLALRAEGAKPTEASATMKYNRNRNVFTTQIQIPDFDVEAGVKVGMTDSAKGKSITLEISNKNVPQLSLIGRAKLQAMTDGMLQVQLLVPSLKTDAAITATMSKAEGLTLEIKSDVKLPETSSIQAVTFKYGEDQAEVQLMSNMNADTKILVRYTEALQFGFLMFVGDVMDQQVVKTDMKLRHIFNKAVEAGNIWMDKISTDVPYVETLKNRIANVEMPSMPENLFMNLESTFKYQFNQDRLTISIPLPLGGKSSEELRIPPMVTSPRIYVPQLGMDFATQEIQIPTFTIPSEYDLTLPLMGMVEVSSKVNSNYYNWEATVSAGNNTAESPSYLAKFRILADSPIKLLSFSTEGATKITDSAEKTMKFTIEGSLNHMLMNTGFNVLETIAVTDSAMSTGRYNVYALSPLGLDTSLNITTQVVLDSNQLSGDVNTDGRVTVGPMTASTTYLHTFSVKPAKKEAKLESTLRVNSEILKVVNKIKASYEKEELLIESNTNINSDPIKHTTKLSLSYKHVKLTMQSDSVTKADERMLRSQMELSASGGQASLRIENQADDSENRAYSLLTGSMNPSGLEINADASLNIFSTIASHKATLALNTNGLTTSCTTTAQHSPMTFENVFHGGVDTSGATMSLTTKGAIKENKAELNFEGKIASTEVYLNSIFKGNFFDTNTRNRVNLRLNEDGLILSNNIVGSLNEMRTENTHSLSLTLRSFTLRSKTDNFLDKRNSYMHDITVNMERFTALVNVKNDLKIMEINFVNDVQFKAEPYNMELTGTMMGIFSEEELKHTYEVKFVDMVLSTKCNTNGKLLGTHMTHTTDMEVAGLTMKFNNMANFNSPSLRLDSTVKTVAAPFTLNIDAIFNSNGAVYLYGQQSGELYSKFLLKAEPLLFTNSFEYRASSTHELEGRPTIKTNMDNKVNSMLRLQDQSVTLKMTSKVNEHTFEQELSAYNNAERMGVEMAGKVSTPASQDYTISGFVKYDKNSDSHFIQIPFVEHLPAVIDNVKATVMRLMDHSIEMLKDINTKYEISAKFQNKVSELKEVIDNFDFNLFVQDLRKFINSAENVMINLTTKFPTDKVMNMLKSIKDAIMAWIQKHNIANNFNVIYAKMEEILSSFEVEKMIGAMMDEVVKMMKQYQVREKIQSATAALKSIKIQPLLKRVMVPVQDLVNELYSFDLKQLIDDMSDYFMRMAQKIKSFDYDTFTMELKEKVVDMSQIPCFGKLYGEFRLTSPYYSIRTTADLENTTSVMPEFKMNLNSQATSTLKVLDFTVDASALLSAPKNLYISENIKVAQSVFTLDHKGTITLNGLTAEGSAETTANINSELYVAELVNNALFAMENGVSANVETGYKHDFNMPTFNIFSETSMSQKTVLRLEDGTAHLTINNLAGGKYAVQDFSDEANHKSDMEVVMDLHTSRVTFTGATGSSNFKMNQNVVADICIFRHIIIDTKVETETPVMKASIAEMKFQAKTEDMQIDFTASHNAELAGQVEGTLLSSVLALVSPSELMFETKNKGNAKVALPFSLSGKMDLQNDISFTLNSEVQQGSWTGLARFNQYKYSHHFAMDNGDREINIISQINGEADLDVLKKLITIPEITVPFVGMKTPRVEDYSLWEDTGLSNLLTTTQQTFDMNSKVKYMKNPEMITIDINVDPIINVINKNVKTLHKKVLIGKDKAAAILATSYDNAKAEYEKYSIDLPKTITVPAYKVPVINVEVSTFTIPLPDFSLITMPALHVPSALSKLTLPKITVPKIQSIKIPVMGDLTYEFSIKTAMITLKTDASILNQDSIIFKIHSSSSSECEFLTGKIEGNTNVNTDDGFKIASVLSVKHSMLEGNHDSAIILSYGNVDTSITNSAKITLPDLTMEIYQEITGNPEQGLVVSMSTPSAGLIALQMQTKRPALVKARLYGRYPSEPTTDIDILGLKMSVMNSEKLNLQTTWNMEMPYELMLRLKEQVPTVMKMVSDPAVRTYNEIHRRTRSLEISFEQAREQGKVMFKRAVDNLAAVNPSSFMTTVTDKTILILREYQKKVEIVLDAVVKFLRETRFQIPGYEERLSGLEVYQKFSAFVADVSEEAVQKIPEYFASMFTGVLDYFKAIEFTLPGSNHVVSAREILDDLFVALRKIQDQVIVTVRKLGNIQLEDIVNKLSAFVQFTTEQSEKFLQTLKSQNVEKLSTFVTDVYNDAINSPVLADIAKQVKQAHRIVMEYLNAVRAKFQNILADMSSEQLKSDIQSWIDLLVKRVNAFHNNVIKTLKEKSKSVEPFVRVGDRQMEVDIPLPFVAKFN